MGTAPINISDQGDTEAAKLPTDKLAATRSMLVALRNNEAHRVLKLKRAIPEVMIIGHSWTEQNERRCLDYIAVTDRETSNVKYTSGKPSSKKTPTPKVNMTPRKPCDD